MKLTTVEEMRHIDRRAIEEMGIPEIVLMENAAREIFQALDNLIAGVQGKRICLVAGTGNNGGDALAVARYVANNGGKAKVFLLGKSECMSKSAAMNFRILTNMGLEMFWLSEESSWDKLSVVLKTSAAVVDGLLGTGFHGELRENSRRLIEMINKAQLPVVAVDVPSGVNADSGQVGSTAVRAAVTVTLGRPKWGMLFAPGSMYCGKLLTDGIGIPTDLLEADSIQQILLEDELVKDLLLLRPGACHKGSCGRIFVIAGSKGMTGAAALTAQAALTAGAGIVTLACPASLNAILEVKLTEVMTLPLEDQGKGYFSRKDLSLLLQEAAKYDEVLVGPGLGRQQETQELVRDFVLQTDKPVVLDADGIYAFREQGDLLTKCRHRPVLTPHLGEMAVLLGISAEELRENLLDFAREAAKEYNSVFVIKSETTIIAYPDGMVYAASTGNPGMATAGCGDVLAGTIAGLYQQAQEGRQPLAGVHIHGRAGDLAYEEKGNCLLAWDIIRVIPAAVQELTVG